MLQLSTCIWCTVSSSMLGGRIGILLGKCWNDEGYGCDRKQTIL